MSDDKEHAVRWLQRKLGLLEQYSLWHWTEDASRTLCGRMIPVGRDVAFLPETDEDPSVVECVACKRTLTK